jgi:G3E family GTPase
MRLLLFAGFLGSGKTVDTPYNWLNNIIAVSVGKQEAMGVTYDVYQIL